MKYLISFETNELRELADHCKPVRYSISRMLLTSEDLFIAPSLQLKPQRCACFPPMFRDFRKVFFELALGNGFLV